MATESSSPSAPVTSHQSPGDGGADSSPRREASPFGLRMTGEEAAVLPSNLPCQGEGERRETARRRGVPPPRPDPKAVILSEAQAKSKDPLRSGVFLGIPRLRILRFAQNDSPGGQSSRPAIHLFACLFSASFSAGLPALQTDAWCMMLLPATTSCGAKTPWNSVQIISEIIIKKVKKVLDIQPCV